jgi:hypothetical protein
MNTRRYLHHNTELLPTNIFHTIPKEKVIISLKIICGLVFVMITHCIFCKDTTEIVNIVNIRICIFLTSGEWTVTTPFAKGRRFCTHLTSHFSPLPVSAQFPFQSSYRFSSGSISVQFSFQYSSHFRPVPGFSPVSISVQSQFQPSSRFNLVSISVQSPFQTSPHFSPVPVSDQSPFQSSPRFGPVPVSDQFPFQSTSRFRPVPISFISQKTTFFIVTALKTSNLT